ncbi:MAG: 30S ribosomal protein S12 methylthiotransferase RimO [Nitrospirae bacterium]|nr:30S ribosomal protein S12 methylthiotransferase RimO [Nitrospirota bacterium]MCL5422979.1 30S ribosomal protein S12 methylthiotransferase RimO [Nitrospirota bacterium]
MPKVSMVSLGCPKNLVDSDTLVTKLRREGFLYTPETENADLVLVNTCGFIEDAKKESVEEILKLKHITEEGRKLLVFGCLAKRYGDELKKEVPEIDGLWGVGEEDKIVEYCKETMKRRHGDTETRGKDAALSGSPRFRVSAAAPDLVSSYAYLKVAEGCSRGCAYCVIPSIRGPFRSMGPDKILERAEEHISSGAKELVLVAQDLGNYGREYSGYTLSSLVRDIAFISGDFRIRLLYLNPTSINDELLSVVAEEEKVCKYLDIPLQHSEDRILKAMGRGGTRRSITRMIKKIREAIPGITLRTTFIVGFPGESEEDFGGLKGFIEETAFERLGVFTYSREEGTPASKMKGNIPRKTKEKRRDEIMRLQSSISLEKNRALVGKKFRVIVDEVEGGTAIGRLSSQAPEIDGVVFIEQKHGAMGRVQGARRNKDLENSSLLRLHASRSLKAGEFVDVKILEAYDYDLEGEPAA